MEMEIVQRVKNRKKCIVRPKKAFSCDSIAAFAIEEDKIQRNASLNMCNP